MLFDVVFTIPSILAFILCSFLFDIIRVFRDQEMSYDDVSVCLLIVCAICKLLLSFINILYFGFFSLCCHTCSL